ncbi:unnamed protein product (macronuclear) [Paramecium tetraurelia]|uniref:U-box domain-containing protein n=1 Tax=Paramecium tetraurelia TaxID=5888 RepID=A0CUK1_PARTE|nr:uncharacterized protein GSPATT00010668001 [Paramecium tetraurelia]CAK74468.1 unnamed protein product [Paramecium tetraurelia]|eukprot:XP_001441865.1 hypothetical protein (macronuclear) [Paramecium tetraurelia strain d4-2]
MNKPQQHEKGQNQNGKAWLYALGGLAIGVVGTIFGMKAMNNEQSQTNSQSKSNPEPSQITSDGEQFLETLCCPITGELIVDAAQLSTCGHTFEKFVLLEWLKKSKNCPQCRKPASEQDIIKNYALQQVIDQHRTKQQ